MQPQDLITSGMATENQTQMPSSFPSSSLC